jgi:Fe-S oxidoreductase
MLVVLGWAPRLANRIMALGWVTRFIRHWVGIVDSPPLSEIRLSDELRKRGATAFDPGKLRRLSDDDKNKTVLVAQDVFTTYYESNVALAVYDVLTRLGLTVVFLPFRQNGKGLHIKGFMGRFRRLVRSNTRFYRQVSKLGIPMVGIEPAVTLTYRDEYRTALESKANKEAGFSIQLLQEYLSDKLSSLDTHGVITPTAHPLVMFGHCTERTEAVHSQRQWQMVFAAVGLQLELKSTGCCGMCGVFGHEAEHIGESRGVFDMSWANQLPTGDTQRRLVLASGHSCRSQVKRFAGFVPRHPIEALRDHLRPPRSPAES